MVIRRRVRAIVFPLVFYAVSGTVSSFFVWHALHGDRGLEAKEQYRRTITKLDAELVDLRAEHKGWRHRVVMMRSASLDRDLLDEEARTVLDRVNKNDLVIFLPQLKPE
jgi:cell division protein FtsB